MKKRNLINSFIWLFAIFLIVFTFKELPFVELGSKLKNISLMSWIILSIVNVAILFLAVKRWQILARIFEIQLPLTYFFKLRQAGSMISFLTPGPQFGGEPIQVFWLNQNHAIPLDIGIATVGIDRYFETVINLFILLLCICFILFTGIEIDLFRALLFILSALIVIVMTTALFIKNSTRIIKTFDYLITRFFYKNSFLRNNHQEKLSKVDQLIPTIKENQSKLFCALFLALFGWLTLMLELYLMMDALNLSPNFYDVVLIMLGIRLALLMPIPGGLGTVEVSLLWSFGILDLALAGAGGIIAISRFRDLLLLLIGMTCLSNLTKYDSRPKHSDSHNL